MEDQLWKAIRHEDKEAFTEMYKTYYQFLFSYGMRISGHKDLTKDTIHELFLEIWKKRNQLPEVEHIGYYLKTILKRKITREIPKEQAHRQDHREESQLNRVEYSYEELLIQSQSKEEMQAKVRTAILSLSKKQMEVIRMKFFDNKSYDEIASLTATTPRTIYNQVYESLRILRKCLTLFF